MKWLTKGDRNSTFVHLTTSGRRRRNQITRIQNGGGDWIDTLWGIEEEFFSHFASVFETKGASIDEDEVLAVIPRHVKYEMNEDLMREVTDEEVKSVVFQLGGVKAPSPNGFQGLFHRRRWQTVGPDIITAVKSFLMSRAFPSTINNTDIILIVKIPSPTRACDYMLISLCNFI